jgi:hypothetical protein
MELLDRCDNARLERAWSEELDFDAWLWCLLVLPRRDRLHRPGRERSHHLLALIFRKIFHERFVGLFHLRILLELPHDAGAHSFLALLLLHFVEHERPRHPFGRQRLNVLPVLRRRR